MKNNVFDVLTAESEIPVFANRADTDDSYLQSDQVTLRHLSDWHLIYNTDAFITSFNM